MNGTGPYSLWLGQLTAHYGVTVDASLLKQPEKLLSSYKGKITGYVKCTMPPAAKDNGA